MRNSTGGTIKLFWRQNSSQTLASLESRSNRSRNLDHWLDVLSNLITYRTQFPVVLAWRSIPIGRQTQLVVDLKHLPISDRSECHSKTSQSRIATVLAALLNSNCHSKTY
ncbi:hypothetical protein PGT21_033601 [Puccinia graminis f. sp. tritici]|uniref:Uncharacterized protein n=1 Tax=Puccinia graminis f. sp. tritici TaxID=56615 RepID=A0A5B0P0C4_PUCGR|nr:hypothetical protein PGTUg99_014941 [Puccinia graminis f. sp. tritici]KAA1094961.1 hypothetical protein PGT21_033601 [Puccinia graminis f. sp. tritici]